MDKRSDGEGMMTPSGVCAKCQVDRHLVRDLVLEGLITVGEHHKQWFLEEIIKALGYAPLQHPGQQAAAAAAGYEWEPGVAP